MDDINPDILKTAAGILRKRALELYSLEDDSELRAFFYMLVESKLELNYLQHKRPSRTLDAVI